MVIRFLQEARFLRKLLDCTRETLSMCQTTDHCEAKVIFWRHVAEDYWRLPTTAGSVIIPSKFFKPAFTSDMFLIGAHLKL